MDRRKEKGLKMNAHFISAQSPRMQNNLLVRGWELVKSDVTGTAAVGRCGPKNKEEQEPQAHTL